MFSKLCLSLVVCVVLLAAAIALPRSVAQAQSLAVPAATTTDPSSQQIYDAARAGNLAQAQQMIDRVLQDHPGSAKAHYVASEVYARSGNLTRARREFSEAQTLAPGLPFATSSSVDELQQQLSGRRILYGTPLVRRSSGVSWGGILLIVAVVAIVLALLRRRRVVSPYAQPYGSAQPGVYPNANPYGPFPGAGPYGPGAYGAVPGAGSGLMGNLATGLAVGAGVAAGERLVQNVLGSGVAPGGVIPSAEAGELPQMPDGDMGGNDFGLTDGSSWDSGADAFGGGGDLGGGDLGGGSDWT